MKQYIVSGKLPSGATRYLTQGRCSDFWWNTSDERNAYPFATRAQAETEGGRAICLAYSSLKPEAAKKFVNVEEIQ